MRYLLIIMLCIGFLWFSSGVLYYEFNQGWAEKYILPLWASVILLGFVALFFVVFKYGSKKNNS